METRARGQAKTTDRNIADRQPGVGQQTSQSEKVDHRDTGALLELGHNRAGVMQGSCRGQTIAWSGRRPYQEEAATYCDKLSQTETKAEHG
jgi:hypothetical protein